MTDHLRLLAETTTDCPECQGYDASLRSQGLDKDPRTGEKLCQRCDKNGKVPLILEQGGIMTEGTERKPNPGSAEAVRQGCTCAVWDNRYGRGVFDAPDGLFWITEDCPLHGKGTARWKIHE